MKQLALALFSIILLSGCLKEPTTPSLEMTPNGAQNIGDEFTLTLSQAEDYTCVRWFVTDTYDNIVNTVNTISGGGSQDNTWTVSIDSSGTYKFKVYTKNCKGDSDPCVGNCKSSEEYDMTVTIN